MKNFRILAVLLLLLMPAGALYAQEPTFKEKAKIWVHKGDSLLNERYTRITFDTNYIQRPEGRFLIKTQANLSGLVFDGKESFEGEKITGIFKTNNRTTISLGLTYQGITLGVTFNPTSLGKKKKGELEFSFNIYDNRFILDFNYYKSNTFRGSISVDDFKFEFEKGKMNIKLLNIAGYYTFNNKRFSFPAAFNQTYIQKKSAGSILAGFAYQGGTIKAIGDYSDIFEDSFKSRMAYFGIGVGYGYNFVFGKSRWLLHASVLPTLVLYNKTTTIYGDEKEYSRDKFPVFVLNEHFALVHFFGPKVNFFGARYLAGITFEENDMKQIRTHSAQSQSKWVWRLFIGARF